MNMNMKGSFVALITPFTEHGQIDILALRKMVNVHVEEKSDGIVCLGSTGEKFTLSHEEQLRVVDIILEEVNDRIPVIVGTGTNNTSETVTFTKIVQAMGVSAALVVVPYYNRPTAEGCLCHYRAVADLGLPVIAYHHPGRTGKFLSVEDWKRIVESRAIVALKESSGDLSFIQQLQQEIEIPIFCGDDDILLPCFTIGAAGSISVMANLFPSTWNKIVHALMRKEEDKIVGEYERLLPLIRTLFLESNPIGIKYAMSQLGLCTAKVRLPLTIATNELQQKIVQELTGLASIST